MKSAAFVGVLVLVGVALWLGARGDRVRTLSPPEILGGPLRMEDESGDRLYLLTSQWEKRVTYFGRWISTPRTVSWLHIDLWALDAATAQPVFRRRLKRDQVDGESKAMGMDQGLLWARLPELVGIRLADGEIVADAARIEARNPELAGLLPTPPEGAVFVTQEMQPLKFIADVGLVILLADARQVRIDPLTLAATPHHSPAPGQGGATGSATSPGAVPVNAMNTYMDWRAVVRGARLASDREIQPWLGLIAEGELADQETLRHHIVANWWDYSKPQRQRLYRAELREIGKSDLEPVLQAGEPTPVPDSPEFLMAGLLTQGSPSYQNQPALWRRDPDSVFLISLDRLGDDGHLQLARVAAPAGQVMWSTALPLSAMHAWLPAERHALMLGPDPAAPRSPMAEEDENQAMQIVSIDLASGAVQSFDLDLQRDWPVDERESAEP